MSRCPLCGGQVLYAGFKTLECVTEGCPNGRPEAVVPEGPHPRQLARFALGLAMGQQWMEVSSGQLYELTAFGTNSVDLDACFLRGSGQWTKRTVSLVELSDPSLWRCLAPGPTSWMSAPQLPAPRPRRGRP